MQEENETMKNDNEKILEIFGAEYKSILRKYECEVERYAIKMSEDYEQFFRWYGGKMYKAQINLKVMQDFRFLTRFSDSDKIKMALENHINNIELSLIEGYQYPTNINLMHNVADMLGREAKQEQREDFRRLLDAITGK